MADASKYIPIVSDPKSFFSIPKTRKTLTFAYAFTFAFVAFTVFLAFCPSPNTSSPFFTNIFSSTASSTSSTTAYKSQLSSIFSFLFNTTTSSSSSSSSNSTHATTTSRSTNTTFQSPPTTQKPFKATPFQNHTQTTSSISKIPTNQTEKPRDRVVNKEPSSASNHTQVSGTSYEDKALNKSNRSSNGVASLPKVSGGSPRENLSSPVKGEGVVHGNYTASLVKKQKDGNKETDSGVEDEKIEALIKCDFFDGQWIKDDSYPLYEPGSCNLIDEQFSCIQNGRPDKDYQKYKWKPKGCSLPR